jgi:predicted ATPase
LLPVTVQALVEVGPDLIDTFVPGAAMAAQLVAWGDGQVGLRARLEELVARREVSVGSSSPEQVRLFEQYTSVLKSVAEHQPLLLIVDDWQWADDGSISLLFHLGRRIEGSRILIVGAYRPEDVALGRGGQRHPLEPVVNEFKRAFGDICVDLEQTLEAQGRRFVDALLDSEPNRLGAKFRAALYRQTAGHPLFTVELLRDMQGRGDLVRDAEGRWVEGPALDWEILPARVEAAIAERIGRLDEELREALAIASIEGETFTAEVIAQVQAADRRGIGRRLSTDLDRQHRLVRAEEVRMVGTRRMARYRFRHFLFQKYVYSHLDLVERAYLHGDVGNVLEALYGDQAAEIAVQLARHFREAGNAAKAVDYLLQAGNKALRLSAHAEAITHLTVCPAKLQSTCR